MTKRALDWAGFGVGYLFCFFLTTVWPPPLPWYLPTERRFALGVRVDGLAADYYGRVLWCLIAGAVGFGLARALFSRRTPASQAVWLTRLGAWCLSLLVFTGALYVYLLVGRHSAPAPLPAAYVPR